MQRMNTVRVGENAVEQHELDLALETERIERINRAIKLARDRTTTAPPRARGHLKGESTAPTSWRRTCCGA